MLARDCAGCDRILQPAAAGSVTTLKGAMARGRSLPGVAVVMFGKVVLGCGCGRRGYRYACRARAAAWRALLAGGETSRRRSRRACQWEGTRGRVAPGLATSPRV
jgi:hypothetical protein